MFTIAFDADDTLWDNEIFFRQSEKRFCELLADYKPEEEIMPILFDIEVRNLQVYGFGVKSFVLSAIEAAGIVTDNKVPFSIIDSVMKIGRDQLAQPVTLLPGVAETLQILHNRNYPVRIIVATKGDLLDQDRKIELSGLRKYFDHTFIMCDKQISNYQQLLDKLNCSPEAFLMIGNSLKSDALPVLRLGGRAISIPYHTTWQHEVLDPELLSEFGEKLNIVESISDILPIIDQLVSHF